MSRLERAKRFLKQTTRSGLRVVSLALLAGSAYAGSIVVVNPGTQFFVSGVFSDGEILSGTLNIDTVGSLGIESDNLSVSGSNGTYQFSSLPVSSGFHSFFFNSSSFEYYNAVFDGASSSTLTLDIYMNQATSFAGYTGSYLCSTTSGQTCGGNGSSYTGAIVASENPAPADAPGGDPPLSSGSVMTPEPSTALLLLTGAAAVVALRRGKRSA